MIDHLTTLPSVDADRIGAMGICAGGGYTANAAINDRPHQGCRDGERREHRVVFRNSWNNNIKSADAIPVLENGSQARTPT